MCFHRWQETVSIGYTQHPGRRRCQHRSAQPTGRSITPKQHGWQPVLRNYATLLQQISHAGKTPGQRCRTVLELPGRRSGCGACCIALSITSPRLACCRATGRCALHQSGRTALVVAGRNGFAGIAAIAGDVRQHARAGLDLACPSGNHPTYAMPGCRPFRYCLCRPACKLQWQRAVQAGRVVAAGADGLLSQAGTSAAALALQNRFPLPGCSLLASRKSRWLAVSSPSATNTPSNLVAVPCGNHLHRQMAASSGIGEQVAYKRAVDLYLIQR